VNVKRAQLEEGIVYITTVYFHSNTSGQNKLLFGNPAFTTLQSNELNFVVGFNPDSIFCMFSVEYGKFGTRKFNLFILRSLNEFEHGSIINFVKPGAEILLHASGKKHVNRVLRWLNELHLDNETISSKQPAFFQAASNRFTTNTTLRKLAITKSVTLERHADEPEV